jgi:hypothetical protein
MGEEEQGVRVWTGFSYLVANTYKRGNDLWGFIKGSS